MSTSPHFWGAVLKRDETPLLLSNLRLLCLRTKNVQRGPAQNCAGPTRTGVSPKLGIPPHFTNLSRKNQIAQRVSQKIFLNDINQIPASGGQFMPTCGVLPMVFPVVLCYTERKDANAAETGRFSACTVSIVQNGVSGWF